MIFYGQELTSLGIVLIILAAVYGIISFSLHMLLSSKVKKDIEKDYGKMPKRGDRK